MGQSFLDSNRYAEVHASPNGAGDARPTALGIIGDNDQVDGMQDKVIFVTGGSNGIGVEEVRAFANTGARVFFAARDRARGEKVKEDIIKEAESQSTKTPRIEVLDMELKSLKSVRAAVEKFKMKSDRLNILVNNAGMTGLEFLTSLISTETDQSNRHCYDTARLHRGRV